MLSTVLYYELAMKVPIPVGITVYLLTWGLGHLRCLVYPEDGPSAGEDFHGLRPCTIGLFDIHK